MLNLRRKNFWIPQNLHPYKAKPEFHVGGQKVGGPHFHNPNFLVSSANWPNEQHMKKLLTTFALYLSYSILRAFYPNQGQ